MQDAPVAARGRWAHKLLIAAVAIVGLSACTLDFDEFLEAKPDPDVLFVDAGARDVGPQKDMRPLGDDMLVVPDDLGVQDGDGDGLDDGDDNCPMVANPDQADADGDMIGDVCDEDTDGDMVNNDVDNCPDLANPGQLDLDRDMIGDDCDDDPDGDGLDAAGETERGTDPLRGDTDGDGVADGADSCPLRADPVGADTDGDGVGNACDGDDDGDGVWDWLDNCPWDANPEQEDACAGDIDGDGVGDEADTCPYILNEDQAITPCISQFETLTYTQDVHAVKRGGLTMVAGTSGGAISIDAGVVTRWTNADGFVGNRVSGVAVDGANRQWFTTNEGLVVVRPDGLVISMRSDDADGGPQGALRDVAVSGDTVWVASDAGLNILTGMGWTLMADELPSSDVRAVYTDEAGRAWVVTEMAVLRIEGGVVGAPIAGLPAIGSFQGISGVGDAVWLLGADGAIKLAADDTVEASYTGFSAFDATSAPNGSIYLGTTEGVRRIDADGRLHPAGSTLLPSASVRAVATDAENARWVATGGGLIALDGYFANFDDEMVGSPCVRSTTRVGDMIWIGTDTGLKRLAADGSIMPVEAAALPGQSIYVIRQIGAEVWVGTDNGVGVLGLDGSAIAQHIVPEIPASSIVDIIEGQPGEVWIASESNGFARWADDAWTQFKSIDDPLLLISDNTRSLAYDHNNVLWIGSELGVLRYDDGDGVNGQRPLIPITTNGGQLADPQVQDTIFSADHVYVATAKGVSDYDGSVWSTLRRVGGGFPQEVGTDFSRAVAHDGKYLWTLIGTDPQRQPFGSLVRRVADAPLADSAALSLYNAETAGLIQTSAAGGVAMEYANGELFISFCGDADEPGGFSVLDGKEVVLDSYADIGLPGDGSKASLTRGPDRRPLFTSVTGNGPSGLSIAADGTTEPIFLPPNQEALPVACDRAVDGGNMWCVLEGVGIARQLSPQQWRVFTIDQIAALGDGDMRDIVVVGDDTAWIATANGVVRVGAGNVRSFNNAGTGGGLPSDDVNAVATDTAGVLYAGTAAGVGIYDPGTMMWETLGPDVLGNANVQAVAVSGDGSTLWIGTEDGLIRRKDGMFTTFSTGNGLPVNAINALAIHTNGQVYVGTDAGLAYGDGEVDFLTAGFINGLPGESIYDIVIAPDNQVWVRSNDGVARLLP